MVVEGVELAVTEESILGRGLSVVELVAVFAALPCGCCHVGEIHGMTYYSHLMLGQRRAAFVFNRRGLDLLEVI